MRCSRGSGLLVRDTNLERHVAANNCEYEDCEVSKNTVKQAICNWRKTNQTLLFSSQLKLMEEELGLLRTLESDQFRYPALHSFQKV